MYRDQVYQGEYWGNEQDGYDCNQAWQFCVVEHDGTNEGLLKILRDKIMKEGYENDLTIECVGESYDIYINGKPWGYTFQIEC